MITPQEALNRLIDKNELFYDEMLDLTRQMMRGDIPDVQLAAILIALRVKIENVTEISAAATAMREFATTVQVNNPETLVDACGTGGDGAHTFNISTTAMFVAAAAGARIAKHGGRSVSSSSGSADVLEALGVALDLSAGSVAQCIEQLGIGFMFAPNHHSAMRHVAPVRRALGVRTMFNILGPLLNPAGAKNQLMGVFHPDLLGIQCHVLRELGSRRALIVLGEDGLDELTLFGKTKMMELKDDRIQYRELDAQTLGFPVWQPSEIVAKTAEESKAYLLRALNNEVSAARDIVLLNAGAILYLAGLGDSMAEGVSLAREALASGAALQKLQDFVQLTQQLAMA